MLSGRSVFAAFLSTALLALVLLGIGPEAPAWADAPNFALTNLTGGANDQSFANGINDLGQVVGDLQHSGQNFGVPFLWQDGKLTMLPTLGPPDPRVFGLSTSVASINIFGQAAGLLLKTGEATNVHLAFWDKGALQDLGGLGRFVQQPVINGTGQILFGVTNANPGRDVDNELIPLILDHGNRIPVGLTFVHTFNDYGLVLGSWDTRATVFDDQHLVSAVWQNGVRALVPLPAGFVGGWGSINNLGELGGGMKVGSGRHACLWKDGQIIDLIPPGADQAEPGLANSSVVALNDNDQVLIGGTSRGALESAITSYYWEPGLMAPIPINLEYGGLGNAINNGAQMVGQSYDNHAVLLTPVGGKMLSAADKDAVTALIQGLQNEASALGQTAQGEAQICLTDEIVPGLAAAQWDVQLGLTLCAINELKAMRRLLGRYVPASSGAAATWSSRLAAIVVQLGGNPA